MKPPPFRAKGGTFLVAAGALLASAPWSGASALPKNGENRYAISNYFEFSLSLAPNPGGSGVAELWTPDPYSPSPVVGNVRYEYGYSKPASTGSQFSGYLSGDTAFAAAPITSAGTPFGGGYMAMYGATTAGQRGDLVARDAGTGQLASQKAFSLLWGSASNADRLEILYRTGIDQYQVSITGAAILAAAADLGIAGGINGSGSYYVTINALPALANAYGSMFGLRAYNTAIGGTFELAPLQASASNITANTVLVQPAPASPGGVAGAPAPVLGATPLGALSALSLVGALGLRRRRPRGAARLAA